MKELEAEVDEMRTLIDTLEQREDCRYQLEKMQRELDDVVDTMHADKLQFKN